MNPVAGNDRAFAIGRQQSDAVGELLGDQAGKDTTIVGFKIVAEIFFADDGAGIDDVDQQIIAIFAVGVREIGTDLATFIKESMADSAGFVEHLASANGIAAAGAQVVVETAD